jgi:broad specificity phosphatase PhoE
MHYPVAIEQKRTAMRRLRQFLTVLAMLLCQPALADDAALWAGLRSGGDIALMRHAEAPGTGDPAGFRLDDCATQRNLSGQGRRQAEGAGALFRSKGIASATVYSSQWCRCLDTASGLGLGLVAPQPALNSFFDDAGRDRQQTDALRQLIRQRPPGRPLVMVTHQVNITALTGVYPQSGEIIVVRPENGRLAVMGRISTIK